MSKPSSIPTYGMQQRSERLDFFIRDKLGGPNSTTPHRHEYFQIQINLGGDTVHHIGGAVRPFKSHTLAFILPHRLHLIPHPEGGNFVLINFTQDFLLRHVSCDPMDLEDVPASEAPELMPFRFQEHLDFVLGEADFSAVNTLLVAMRKLDQVRQLGSALMLKGCLLQLIGKVCNVYETELLTLSSSKAEKQGRRDALNRVTTYLRKHIANPALTLTDTAAAAFLSPNYLTHLLRKETGSTFSELVSGRRLRLARSHLIHGTEPLSQVAALCGFSDEAYFSRRFRNAYGVPPGQFRKEHQRE